jgi:hypothetical protein
MIDPGDGHLARLPEIQHPYQAGATDWLSLSDLGAGAVYLADKANETVTRAALPSPGDSVAMNGQPRLPPKLRPEWLPRHAAGDTDERNGSKSGRNGST